MTAPDPNIESRLAALEKKFAEAIAASEQKTLGILQTVIEGLKTLDQKTNTYRSADFLAQLSRIYPKRKSVLFMGRSYFGDNIKYAYLAFAECAAQEKIDFYFLPRDARQHQQISDAGLPCLPVDFADYSAAQIDILLGTHILVLDEQFIPPNWRHFALHALLRGAKTIQLWHGIPLKKLGMEIAADVKLDNVAVSEIFAACGPFDVFVSSSLSSRTDWQRKYAFHAFAPIGYPRDDVLFREITTRDSINIDAKAFAAVRDASGKSPVILYAPTFRDQGGMAWFEMAKINMLADHCAAKGYLLYVNLHPGEQGAVDQFRKTYPSIRFIEPQTDIYPILKYTSLFISDYSSLAFDFLLLDRPVLFYRPDHADYVAHSRQLIADQDKYICGPVANNAEELIQHINQGLKALAQPDTDPYSAARNTLKHALYDDADGKAGQRLNDMILAMLKDTP